MATVTYIDKSGNVYQAEVEDGVTLMEGAVHSSVPGIDAECGGACVCATCHIYIDEEWQATVGRPNEIESMTLEEVDGIKPSSRLACQIAMSSELDGLVVHVANE
ncbi:2Fe-2S iron-sulfur cluster-binding protein [Marinobacter sp. X15-166B]|uniref:2Fe-2S iron-sulfur cluster-binding protein n=1 Tax=Marinobacter sp. X15-166B TaxID=1897620 RepID=UPI00085C8043|nr:2Fe-2S iron-sulfur cluster-binding protein [Marinobacter sp. X15-166B]OEY65939.1 2Fe-2S ferredoxin [Marinobacter sp. X15-166B]